MGGASLRKDRPGQWYPLKTPDGTEVWPIKNDGEEGHWRWGKNQKMKDIIADPEQAHWELRPFDPGVSWQNKTKRLVPYEKIRDKSKSIGWSTWLDSYGFNSDATRELKNIFGEKPFETPKPLSLIKWIISLHTDTNALVIDSFAGSGVTGHAVLDLNKEDGGNRRFIIVEMESEVAKNITYERIRRVSEGYKNLKGEDLTGLGSGFKYCCLGENLFEESGKISRSVNFIDLARFVFFKENGVPLPNEVVNKSPLIGTHNGTAIYLLYNGILADKTPKGGNALTREVLSYLPPHDGPKVVYGTSCRVGATRLKQENIVFRQIPYELKVD